MKYLLLILFLYVSTSAFSQRYLTFLYPQLDSLIGGVYGTAVNSLSVNQNLLFDFYAPNLDSLQQRPLIIYIHGGGFTSGTRSYPSIKLLCRKMAMKGYAVANIDYRLDPTFNVYASTTDRRAMTDAMHDAKQAIRYFKANAALFKLDTNKIFIGGESAGAITAMMASYVDKQAEMTTYPMANPNNPVGSTANSAFGNDVNATMCLCGAILDTSAIENENNSPLLWTHGSADNLIPLSLAYNIVIRATNIGLPIQTKLYQGGLHCPWNAGNPNWQTYLDSTINDITTFLYPKVLSGFKNLNVAYEDINVYPNPVNNFININFAEQHSKIYVSLVEISGKLCKKWNLQNVKKSVIDVSNFESGFYFLKICLENNQNITKKIFIDRN